MTAHKHAAAMLQYAADAQESETPWERWECHRSDEWIPLERHPVWRCDLEYRRKATTLTTTVTIPEPCRVAPSVGTMYWTPTYEGGACEIEWRGTENDTLWLELGQIHLTREAAQAHADALLSIGAPR